MRMQPKKIICTTDFSDLSKYSVSYGIALSKEFNAKLYLCHVIDISSATMYSDATFAFEDQNRYMQSYAHEQFVRLIGDHQIDWEPLVVTGHAADEVARIAEEKEIDIQQRFGMKIPKWVCHQLPERSFHIHGRPLPLCARCTGYWSALVAGILVNTLLQIHSYLPRAQLFWVVVLFTIPMGLDGVTQLFGWRESNNPLRFLTGVLSGFWCGVAAWVIAEKFFFS